MSSKTQPSFQSFAGLIDAEPPIVREIVDRLKEMEEEYASSGRLALERNNHGEAGRCFMSASGYRQSIYAIEALLLSRAVGATLKRQERVER